MRVIIVFLSCVFIKSRYNAGRSDSSSLIAERGSPHPNVISTISPVKATKKPYRFEDSYIRLDNINLLQNKHSRYLNRLAIYIEISCK